MNQIYFLEISNIEEDFNESYAFDASCTNAELANKIKEVVRKNVYETYIKQHEEFEEFWDEYDFEANIEESIETENYSWNAPDFDFSFYLKRFDLIEPCENINSVVTITSFDRDLFLAFNGDNHIDIIMSKLKPFIRECLKDEYDNETDFNEYWEVSEFRCTNGSFWDADDNEWWINHSKMIK